MKEITAKTQLIITVSLLFAIAIAGIFYKVYFLQFNLRPNDRTLLWQVEARIDFKPGQGPVKISLAAPEDTPGYKVFSEDQISDTNYRFQYTGEGDRRRAEWDSENSPKDAQTIFYRMRIFDTKISPNATKAPQPALGEKHVWGGPSARLNVKNLLDQASADHADTAQFTLNILDYIFHADTDGVKSLLPEVSTTDDKLELAINLLLERDIPARPVYGVQLIDGRRRQLIKTLEVYFNGAWHGYDVNQVKPGFPDQYLALRRGDKSLLDVEGGTRSSVRYSVFQATIPSLVLIPAKRDFIGRILGSLSVYELPLESQNLFKRIALIPLGILLVVLIRNVVGIQTMGTFMPVLIALAFMETELIPGLISFLIIIVLGLLVRFYLSRLNLLLVPRIAAVVLVVIFLMKIFSLLSHNVGFTYGLSVALFPLIIMAWTIERASILWEEDGALTTAKQFGASMVSGLLCYFVMSNRYVQHATFAFAEIDLIVLGLILLLGTYSGYRLTELKRFKSLVIK